MALKFLARFRDFGLLILRVGVGASFVVHGSGKMFQPEGWAGLGGAMANFGITFYPAVWGAAAAFAEFGGGILMILGFLFRPAAFMLACTMVVAFTMHFQKGDPFAV